MDFSILRMTPKEILRKEPFRRTLPSAVIAEDGLGYRTGGFGDMIEDSYDPLRFQILSQADFLREFDPNSHLINSIKYYPNQFSFDAQSNKLKRKVKSRVAIAWQRRIFTKRIATLTGNNIALSIANAVTGEQSKETLRLFREGWQVKDMENAIFEAFCADGKTGDCAVCFYKDEGKVGWRVFSFEKGDKLFPHYDPKTGRLGVFGRKYASYDEDGNIEEYLDVWDSKFYARYKFATMGKSKKARQDWVVDIPAEPHNFSRIPIAYDRYGEPFWAASQSLIDMHEMAMSQLAENNAAYALRILMLMGAEMEMQSSVDGTPTVINSPDPNAKAAFLEPADSSGAYDVQLKALEQNIMRCSFAVETPEIKSGSDLSSLTVKTLNADAYQKALEDSQHFQPFLNDIVEIFKEGYGTEIGKISDFNLLKVKAEILPYIFMSESEVVNSLVQLVGSKVISHRTATGIAYEMLGYGDIDEAKVILQEEHDALVGEVQATQSVQNQNIINQTRNSE